MSRPAWFEWIPVAPALWLVGSLAVTVAIRLTYPYDLEWMEGGMLAHAWQLQQGRGLYGPPSPEFAPFVYPPGYPALLAGLSVVFGLGPALGRAVSALGVLAACGAVGWIVHRHARDPLLAALSAVSFLGCYAHGGAFYDLVRPDGLMIGLLSWSVALALVSRRSARIGSGVLLFAAFLVKHNAAFFGPALVLGVGIRDGWRPAVELALSAAVPALLATLVLQGLTDGYFLTYLLAVPASHPLVPERFFPGAPIEIAQALPLSLAAAAVWLLGRGGGRSALAIGVPLGLGLVVAVAARAIPGVRPGLPTLGLSTFLGVAAAGAALGHVGVRVALRRLGGTWVFGVGIAATAFGSAMWMRAHSGGFLNVHIPVFWVVAVAGGIALAKADRRLVAGLFTAQLALQIATTDHRGLRPSDRDREAGERLVQTLRTLPGPIWSPYAAWLPTYAGHEPQVHRIALMDLEFEDGPLYAELQPISDAVRAGRWGAIVTAQRSLGYGVERHYRLRTKLHHPAGALSPKSGWAVRLTGIHVPR